MSNPDILLTGAQGWLGKRLLRIILSQAHGNPILDSFITDATRIRCLILPGQDPMELTSLSPRVECVQGDVRNAADCEAFTRGAEGAVMIHIAGVIHPGGVSDFFSINRDGTMNILEASVKNGLSRVVVMSSNSPCGCNPFRDHLFDEASPFHPYMNYGKSKMEMEKIVEQYGKKGRIETVIIRAPWFYGPDQPDRQILFFSMIKNGKGPIVGDGNNLRSMAYLDNLSQGLLLAAFQPQAAGEVYWIADEKPYTMNMIMDTIERLMEKEFSLQVAHKRMKLPGLAAYVAEMVDGMMQKVGMYNQKIHVLGEMNKTIACSVEKAKTHLGYRPLISLEEGMRRSLQSVFDNGQKI
jgi:nucleoside-diphosphate-sugar epimerase